MNRYKTAGGLIFIMTLVSVIRLSVENISDWVPGVFAALSIALLVPGLIMMQRAQSLVLVSIGLFCAFWANSRGFEIDIGSFFSKNTALLALFAGVSYLRLVTVPQANNSERLPVGKAAYIRTLLGAHFFASVINLSAVTMVTDRLVRDNKLSRELAVPLTRAFGSAAFWSPFFAAMGVAITYAPGASLGTLVLQGLPLAFVALSFTVFEQLKKNQDTVNKHVGYPIHFSALWIPSVLVLLVLLVHELKPNWSVILIVTGLSLLMSLVVSVIKNPSGALSKLTQHTVKELPKMSGEFTLFFSAGVFSAGLGQLLISYDGGLPSVDMNFVTAVVAFISMVLFSIMGIHPLVSIAAVGALFAPAHFDPNVLGFIFLSAWGVGVVVAPLSGLNLALQGRFSIAPLNFIKWHYKYVLIMTFVVMAELWVLMYV